MTASLNILAFDLDNTLLDPGSVRYHELHRTFLSDLTSEVPVDTLLNEFERLRNCGDALERLGLANPIHDRGHAQSLAAFALTIPWNLPTKNSISTSSADRRAFRGALDNLQTLHYATQQGTPVERLRSEVLVRRVQSNSDDLRRLQATVTRLAQEEEWLEQSRCYAQMEARQVHNDNLPLMRTLAARGLTLVVISQGLARVQSAKLSRLGLADFFDGRLLVTENASRIAGWDELERQIDERIARSADHATSDPDLLFLWRFRCIVKRWERKSSEFYGRALHAIVADPHNCERALASLIWMSSEDWHAQDIRFVMVGDRSDADIQPVLANLGRNQSWTVHLRAGRYAADADTRNHGDAHRTFPDWEAVADYLTNALDLDRVNPIRTAPRVFHRSDFDDGLLHCGMHSSLSAVRSISELAKRTMP